MVVVVIIVVVIIFEVKPEVGLAVVVAGVVVAVGTVVAVLFVKDVGSLCFSLANVKIIIFCCKN